MTETLLMIPVRDGLTILTREVDLVFDDDDGGYYLMNTALRKQSRRFATDTQAIAALRKGKLRWKPV